MLIIFRHTFLSVTGLTASCFLLMSCDPNGSLPKGHFEGTLLQRIEERLEERNPVAPSGGIQQIPVGSDISYTDSGSAQIHVKDVQGHELGTVTLSEITSDSLQLLVPGVLNSPMALVKKDGCFQDETELKVTFCYSPSNFILEVFGEGHSAIYTLCGDQFSPAGKAVYETPRAYTLTDAVHTALTQNFQSQLQFEQVMQAKQSASAGYLNLLPHLSLSTALSNLVPTWQSLLSTVGDVAPFLLPTRWYQAQEAALQSKASIDALILMQADAAVQVEGLAYALERDEGIVALYQNLLIQAMQARDLSAAIEKAGTFPAGSTNHLVATIDSMQLDLSALKELVQEDKMALAQAMGFYNPDAITEITFEEESPSWDHAVALVAEEVNNLARTRSFELRQMDDLIQIANVQKSATYFNWLDPAGDPSQNLGLNLGAQIQVASSQVSQLLTEREQLQQTLAQKVFSAVSQYNLAIQDYAQIKSAIELNETRMNIVLSQLVANSNLNTLDVEAIFQDSLAMGIRQETVKASFRVARSVIDRNLLQGAYLGVPIAEQNLLNKK